MKERYSGSGKAYFANNYELDDVIFDVELTEHDLIEGNLRFSVPNEIELESFVENTKHNLKIIGSIDKSRRDIEIRDFIFSRFTHGGITGVDQYLVEAKFEANEILLNPEFLKLQINEELILEFGIRGMFPPNIYSSYKYKETETEEGIIAILIEDDFRILEKKMSETNLPYTIMKIVFNKSIKNRLIEDVITKRIEIVNRLLNLTRFSQGSWQQWAFVKIQKDDDILFERKRSGLLRKTKKFDIIEDHFYEYLSDCYKNTTSKFIEAKKLNVAIDWYIESINGDSIESSIISATTCLELLTDIFVKENDLEYIIDPPKFEPIRESTRKELSKILKTNCIDSETRGKIYEKLSELNRLSFNKKIDLLIKKNAIKFEFEETSIEDTINDLVKIRNSVTHQGTFPSDSKDQITFASHYKKLMHLLIRIILSLFNYRGSYSLPFEGEKEIPYHEWKSTQ